MKILAQNSANFFISYNR